MATVSLKYFNRFNLRRKGAIEPMSKERLRHIHIRIEQPLFKKLQLKALKEDKKLQTILTELIRQYTADCTENELEELCKL